MFDLSLVDPGRATNFFNLLAGVRFRQTISAFDVTNALWLAEISRLIYRRSGEVGSHRGKSRMAFLTEQHLSERFFTDDTTQAAVIDGGSFRILVFRGTEPQRLREDFLTDARIRLVPWPTGGFVHLGFLDAFESIWKRIVSDPAILRPPLFITGHSLGGALATLAAARCIASHVAVVATYTFGAPRVGDETFAKSLARKELYRVVNDRDAVPRLPPFLLRYRHTPKLAKIDHSGRLTFQATAEDALDIQASLLPVEDVLDHFPINYVTLLSDAMRRPQA